MISFRMDFVLLALVAVCSLNMGEGSKQGSVMLEPQFMPLEEGEGSVLAAGFFGKDWQPQRPPRRPLTR